MAPRRGARAMTQTVGTHEILYSNQNDNPPKLSQGETRCDSEASARGGAGGGTGSVWEPVMARGINLLTARFVQSVTKTGRYPDGGGLYLLVRMRGQTVERLWLFRYKRGGRSGAKEKAVSLGTARDVTLANARDKADICRTALANNEDPKVALAKVATKAPLFGEVADALIEAIGPGFENKATLANWKRTLGDNYCVGLRKLPVDEVDTEDVLDVLKDIWQKKPETAQKLRERIERVLDSAKAKGLRSGENPARWRGHLKLLLPAQTAIRGHHRALAYEKMPEFMPKLRALDSISALALEWTILACARTGETIGTPRTEIDRAAKVWTVPAKRMKERREHRVPLCDRCIEIFDEMEKFSNTWLFPARDPREHLSNMAMAECLRGLGADATVHGFRSTFRDWAGDCTAFPREIVEAALSHQVGDEAERAYRRSDALERRRKLMQAWEGYCATRQADNVVTLKR